MLRLICTPVMISTLIVLSALCNSSHAEAGDKLIPVLFQFHCGGKGGYLIPFAMGFSPDSKLLGIVYKNRLILVDVKTGKEIKRIKLSAGSKRVNYNYVVFEPSGQCCCVARFGRRDIDLQFINIEKGIGSELIKRVFSGVPADPSDYESYGYHLPLRQWLAFRKADAPSQESFPVMLSNSEGHNVESFHASVSFKGDDSLQKAERIYTEIRPPLKKPRLPWPSEEAKKFEAELRSSIGTGMQVALSQDERTLLSQRVSGGVTYFQYRFRFYDAKSKESIAEIAIPTGIDWRFNGSRGFAFSPDFRYLARTNPGGRVIVHDLSKLVEREFNGYRSIFLPFRVPEK